MIVYRIDREKYVSSVLSGIGASLHGGRWNRQHTPAVYASESRALALLEILVHVRTTALMPHDRVIISIDIPDDYYLSMTVDKLNPYWNTLPNPHFITQKLFDTHCVLGDYGGLRVPSVIIPEECNIVLNPMDADFNERVTVSDVKRLNWDQRLG